MILVVLLFCFGFFVCCCCAFMLLCCYVVKLANERLDAFACVLGLHETTSRKQTQRELIERQLPRTKLAQKKIFELRDFLRECSHILPNFGALLCRSKTSRQISRPEVPAMLRRVWDE